MNLFFFQRRRFFKENLGRKPSHGFEFPDHMRLVKIIHTISDVCQVVSCGI